MAIFDSSRVFIRLRQFNTHKCISQQYFRLISPEFVNPQLSLSSLYVYSV
ncbi:hypothetical protein D915_010795 [Fasciola hepatica]|uniref:Uncharacterized protein n=1 Tax=Fasciola hepatica TaxID=6192 RepID=A0A4E0QU03_FASHE|nr:hypothetical protein D915_010795 [Fasciola hepatica]